MSDKEMAGPPVPEAPGPERGSTSAGAGHASPTEPPAAVARARREGGPRQNISEPVVFQLNERRIEGWTLNISRGGLRAVVEEPLPVRAEVDVTVGDSERGRRARVVWCHEERGGAVLGLSFLDRPSPVPPSPDSTGRPDDRGTPDSEPPTERSPDR